MKIISSVGWISQPRVSVIMSVFNGLPHLHQAIDSILSQTLFDFEFIIIDDASTDNTIEVLKGYQDSRLRLIFNKENVGVTESLNRGLQAARGEYIARIDADDVATPGRLQIQVDFLDAHPKIGLVGSWYHKISDLNAQRRELVQVETSNAEIQQKMLYCPIFAHSTVMFRKKCIEEVGPYDTAFRLAQDKDLWFRIAEKFEVAVIPEPLVTIRSISTGLGRMYRPLQNEFVLMARENALKRRLEGHPSIPFSTETIARFHVFQALEAYTAQRFVETKAYFKQAISTEPKLCLEKEDILQQLVYRAYYRWQSQEDGTTQNRWQLAKRESEHLIEVVQANNCLMTKPQKIKARFFLVLAFESYQAGISDLVIKGCLLALTLNPGYITNRGMISILVRSLNQKILLLEI